MQIEIVAVGGYGIVGRNMTAVKVGDEVVLLDMGLHLPNYIKLNDESAEWGQNYTRDQLVEHQACPNDTVIDKWKDMVVGIIPTHAHLDHIGAIPYLAPRYKAPIIATPFTSEVIKAIVRDNRMKLPNPMKILSPNSSMKLSKNFSVDFIAITHSTPHAVMIVLRTPAGNVLYTNDFKLDNCPTLGRKPAYKKIEQLQEKGIKVAIIDSLYAHTAAKTPSENVAKEMLNDVLFNSNTEGKGIIVTTFASHIARLRSIMEAGRKLKRKVVFIGRSLAKYCYAAENAGLVQFSKEVNIVKYAKQAQSVLNKINKEGRHKYLLVVTGHQGEPNSALGKIASGKYNYGLSDKDHVVFSSNVIPTPASLKNHHELEETLKSKSVRIFKGVHVSGHGAREDQRQLLQMVKPEHVLPSHTPAERIPCGIELAEEEGYKNAISVHTALEGQHLKF